MLQVLFYGAVPVGALFTGCVEIAAVFPDLIRSQVADKCLAVPDQLQRTLIHRVEIIRSKEHTVLEIRSEPFHVSADGFHEFPLFLCRVSVIIAEIELPAILLRQSEVQKDRLRMSDVQVSVRLRRETGLDMGVSSLRQIFIDLILDKVPFFSLRCLCNINCFAHISTFSLLFFVSV